MRLKDLKVGDTIRVFSRVASGKDVCAAGGCIALQVELIGGGRVSAVIVTHLPEKTSFGTGYSIELFAEEILYKNKVMEIK